MGVHDTNDELVAVTLRALADLIPYLGASIVIGPKRKTLFSNALPKVRVVFILDIIRVVMFQFKCT